MTRKALDRLKVWFLSWIAEARKARRCCELVKAISAAADRWNGKDYCGCWTRRPYVPAAATKLFWTDCSLIMATEVKLIRIFIIMNFMCENNNKYEIRRCYRSPNASTKSAGQQSICFAASAGNESRALHRDRLAEGYTRESRRQECHYDTPGKHKVTLWPVAYPNPSITN